MVTLQNIADEAGVSNATVSNVLNGNTSRVRVSAENAERIREIIKKRGYVPNSSARTLAVKSSKIIAVVLVVDAEINALRDPYNAEFLGEVVCEVQNRGYYVMIRFENKYEDVIQNLRSWNVDGAVFVGTIDSYIRQIQEKINIPLIFTDSYTEIPVSNVGIDDFGGGIMAAECFLRNGHTNLCFAGYSPYKTEMKTEKNVVTERLRGFCAGLESKNITLCATPFYLDGNESPEIHRECVRKIAASLKTQHEKCGVSGVFVSADRLAMELMEALEKMCIHVPADISIIGFDDLQGQDTGMAKLTTIRQNVPKKASVAATMLFEQIANKEHVPENVCLDVELVERDSVEKK